MFDDPHGNALVTKNFVVYIVYKVAHEWDLTTRANLLQDVI